MSARTRTAGGLTAAIAAAIAVIAAACGHSPGVPESVASATASPTTRPVFATGFYPLQFLVEEVGRDRVDVIGLTPAGSDPHDLELTPEVRSRLSSAGTVVFISGMQPALDSALATSEASLIDVGVLATRNVGRPRGDRTPADDPQTPDPHFWLDPTLMALAVPQVRDALAAADPSGAEVYAENAADLVGRLEELDELADSRFRSCEIPTLVTSHDAFRYFAARYDFDPVAVTGVSPDAPATSARLSSLAALMRDQEVTTVYTEPLVSPAQAQELADRTGARTAVLDPIEGLTSASSGRDYLMVMRSNIITVAFRQGCR